MFDAPRIALNTLFSLNRLGRGNAALFLLLSFGAIGTQISVFTHLVLGFTAALWYNGLNDICDYELDREAYPNGAPRKVLLNGALSRRALWVWLGLLTSLCLVLLLVDARMGPLPLGLFGGSILCSVLYNRYSKYFEPPTVLKISLLDAIVGGPFFLFYASLALAADPGPPPLVVLAAAGSLWLFGLWGNYVYASKDLSTDEASTRTLPMLLGARVNAAAKVEHGLPGRLYLSFHALLLLALFAYVAWEGHWFGVPMAVAVLWSHLQLCSGRVSERGHKKLFIRSSNWEMLFLITLHLPSFSPSTLALLLVLALTIILLNVAYHHDPANPRALMLRLPWAKRGEVQRA